MYCQYDLQWWYWCSGQNAFEGCFRVLKFWSRSGQVTQKVVICIVYFIRDIAELVVYEFKIWCILSLITITPTSEGIHLPVAKMSTSSVKCKSVQKPLKNLRDTLVAFTSASKYFLIPHGPPGALKCALRLCKSIFRCFLKYQQLCWCIQDAMRLTTRIVKILYC